MELTRLHTDPTSLQVYGAYERDAGEEGPLVTCGDSRDPRPDLKHVLFGLTGTAAGGPVGGPMTDGHGSDSGAPRCHSTQLRQHRPDLGEPLLVADSQFFAGDTIGLAAAPRFHCVSLGPQTVGLRQKLGDAPELGARPLLWARPGRRTGQLERSPGASGRRPERWKPPAGEVPEWAWRFRVVESTPLAHAKAPRWAAAQQTEEATRAVRRRQWPRRSLACEAEAHQAAPLGLREVAWPSHHLTYPGGAAWVSAKRPPRGRPPTAAPSRQRQGWRGTWPVHEATEALPARARREARFVLATKGLDAHQLSDAERLQA